MKNWLRIIQLSLFYILFLLSLASAQQNQDNQEDIVDSELLQNQEKIDPTSQTKVKEKEKSDELQRELTKQGQENNEDSFKSIMINDEEKKNIDLAIESYKTGTELLFDEEEDLENNEDELESAKKQEEDNKNAFLFLSSIIYKGDNDWAVWLNDQKLSSYKNKTDNEIYIQNIGSNFVDIVWKLSLSKWKILSRINDDDLAPNLNEQNQVVLNFVLKVNQTYSLVNNSVIEGRFYNK